MHNLRTQDSHLTHAYTDSVQDAWLGASNLSGVQDKPRLFAFLHERSFPHGCNPCRLIDVSITTKSLSRTPFPTPFGRRPYPPILLGHDPSSFLSTPSTSPVHHPSAALTTRIRLHLHPIPTPFTLTHGLTPPASSPSPQGVHAPSHLSPTPRSVCVAYVPHAHART
jgi:hypothetical protein